MNIHDRMRADLSSGLIFRQAMEASIAYMTAVEEQRVVPDASSIAGLTDFEESLPENGTPAGEIIDLLARRGAPATVAQTGGRYFGFVNGGAVPAALAARMMGDAWDQNAGLQVISPVAAKLEDICEEWLVDLLGLPPGTAMGLVGGTSVGTFCGLAAARYSLLQRQGWDVNEKGLSAAPRLRVIVSDQAHGTVFKALALLGIGKTQLEIVESDSQGRISADRLPELGEDCLLILQAGNVNSGAFDDFAAIVPNARQAGAWVHVDGAFGLWAAACRETDYLTSGVNRADSWSVDAHKTLNAPYDCGIVLCRDRRAFVSAMQATGSYIQFGSERDGMLYGPDMSRRARSIDLWATLKFLGREGIDTLVRGLCDHAKSMAAGLEALGIRVLNEVVFNQVLIATDDPDRTRALLKSIQDSGELWCGPTVWNGEPAIRVSVCSWKTTEADVSRALRAIRNALDAAGG